MVFQELVDLVELAVNGGHFSSESAAQMSDIESYVPIAAHAIIRNTVFGLKAEGRAERSNTGSTSFVIDPAFFETYEVDVAFSAERNMNYADLPSVVQSWPGDAALNSVFGKKTPVAFTKVNGIKSYIAMEEMAFAVNPFWHEVTTNDSGNAVTRLWLPTADDGVCHLLVTAALEISSSLGDSRVPIPAGMEALICQACVEHFRGQRSMPADVLLTNNDVNATMVQGQ